jgi:hypothetical protein
MPFFKSFPNEIHIGKILEARGKVKMEMENFFPYLPIEYRENLREILNDL